MAIAVDYVFRMDVSPLSIAEDMEQLRLPYPVMKNALVIRVTATSDHVFSEEEKEAFIAAVIKTYKNAKLDTVRVEGIRFERTENVRLIPDEALKGGSL